MLLLADPTTTLVPTGPARTTLVTLNPPTGQSGIPGAHQDGADLYGIVLALAVMGLALLAVRLIFRRR